MVVRFRFLLLAFLVLAGAQPALAGPQSKLHKLDLALRAAIAKAPQPQHVIVRTKAGCRPALRRALIAHGDVVEAEHPTFGALTVYAHGEDLEALANDPCVLTVSSDAIVWSSGTDPRSFSDAAVARLRLALKFKGGAKPGLPGVKPTAAVSELRAQLGLEARDGAGEGITVAILDSGLEMTEDFDADRVEFWDFTRGGFATKPYDDYGHGTHVAGLIASAGRRHPEYAGVAPNVNLKIFKVLDKRGRGQTSKVLRAMEYIIANRHLLGVDIINLSLGHPVLEPAATDPLVQAVELAARRGITVVVSAGNNGYNLETGEVGYGGVESPGNAPSAITVGAANTQHSVLRDDDTVAPFSSRGPTWYDGYAKPDVVAPGVALVSNIARRGTLAQENPSILVESRYASLSGTSMASGVTTGLAAVMLSISRSLGADEVEVGVSAGRPALTPNAIKAVLQYTATPLEGFDLLTQGAGEINGHGAVRVTRAIDTTAPAGTPWANLKALHPVSTVFGRTAGRWFENIVWGTQVVDGDVLAVNSLAWDNIVWGTAFRRDDDNIVWGTVFTWKDDNIVWGAERLTGDDNIVWGAVRFDDPDENIVWGSAYKESWLDNIVWGSSFVGLGDGDNIVWGSANGADNVVWGSLTRDNIVWGNLSRGTDNIVWGSYRDVDDNVVWGTGRDGDNVVWGTGRNRDNVVWGTGRDGDNVVWGTGRNGDNVVWGTNVSPKQASKAAGGIR